MVGVEALVRPFDQQGHPVSPDIFIRIAEATGVIGAVTRFVVHRALSDMRARLTAAGHPGADRAPYDRRGRARRRRGGVPRQ